MNELPVSNEFSQVTKKETDETRVDKGLWAEESRRQLPLLLTCIEDQQLPGAANGQLTVERAHSARKDTQKTRYGHRRAGL